MNYFLFEFNLFSSTVYWPLNGTKGIFRRNIKRNCFVLEKTTRSLVQSSFRLSEYGKTLIARKISREKAKQEEKILRREKFPDFLRLIVRPRQDYGMTSTERKICLRMRSSNMETRRW